MFSMSLLVALAALSDVVAAAPAAKAVKHVIDLQRVNTSPASSRSLLYNRGTNSAQLISVENGAGYAVPVEFGDQSFLVHFDTGSSDLWLPSSNFQCVDLQGQKATNQCGLGTRYQGTFTGGTIPNQNFNVSYGSGEFLIGSLGYESITLANLTVPKQEVALVDTGYWRGDGQVSGLMGFAYPMLTSAFTGTDPSIDSLGTNQAAYSPFFFTATAQNLVAPVFTLELGKSTGQLSLGGIPDSASHLTFTTTPLEKIQTGSSSAVQNFSFYAITPTSYSLNSRTAQASFPVIVDSGTTLTYLPTPLVRAINAAFDPPSLYIPEQGVYENFCDAKPPSFSLMIGGTEFSMKAEDLLLQGVGGYDSLTGGCLVGVQDGGNSGGPWILGETFMRAVVAVFDVGNEEMGFAAV